MNSSFSPPVRTCYATACSLLLALLTPAPAQVVISEIHYHPVEEPAFDHKTNPTEFSDFIPDLDLSTDVHEFIEIQNTGTTAVDLSGWALTDAVAFTFPAGATIAPGAVKVIAKDRVRLESVYAISGVVGNYIGNLSNSGASVRLKDAARKTVDAVTYSASFPWAQSADALGAQDRFTGINSMSHQYRGRSLQRVSATAGSSDPANWLASPLPTGPTPGLAQALTFTDPKPVVIAKSLVQTSDGATVILANQQATITWTFSTPVVPSAVQLEWFVDLPNSTTESLNTIPLTGTVPQRVFNATIPGQAARSVIRYRIKANSGEGLKVISPRNDDPAIAAVRANNAVEPWHGYFVSPVGRPTTAPNYDLFISTANLDKIRGNAQASPGRVTAAGASGQPRSVPWVPATDPQWDGTVPAVFAHQGVLYDVHIRFHGSRYHRAGNSWALSSFKLHFPENQPFQAQTAWFITSHGPEFDEASRLNRLLGLPASKTRNVTWYFNTEPVATRLEQGEYAGEMLADFHRLRHQAQTDPVREPVGELYKNVGNRDKTALDKEGPYTAGDMAPIAANPSWSRYKRYEWMFSLQNHGWKGPRPMADMHDAMWAARGDTYLTPGFANSPDLLARTKAWFNANFDMETTLTAMALVEWMSIWDDGKQNQYFWRRANGLWSRLGWDYDEVMSTSTTATVGIPTQTIWGGEYGAPNVFDGVNWWKDTFYKCFREEYKQRLWQINNSFCDPANLLALGLDQPDKPSKAYAFALLRQANVNSQLGLGTYYKPDPPTNTAPADHRGVLPGPTAFLTASAYSHPGTSSHHATKWEIRSATGNYEEPEFAVTSTTALTSLPLPFGALESGQTYYWRVSYIDADNHASTLSAETRFSWGPPAPIPGNLKLNEILASNTLIKNGTPATAPDYIELHNQGTTAYDLTGVTLTDDFAIPARFTFPAGTSLAAGAHLLVWCDAITTAPGLHTGFGLSSGGETVLLMKGAEVLDSVTFGTQLSDLAIGRIPSGTGDWTATTPTAAAANTAAALGTPTILRINEWMADPAYGDDWFELYNPGTAPVDLGNLYLSNSPGAPATRVPPLFFIGAGGYAKFQANGSTTGINSCNFRLSGAGDSLVLTAANGATNLDIVFFSMQSNDVSEGRFPDGATTTATFTTTASPEKPNWLPAPVVINEALAKPAAGGLDRIELHNPGSADVNLGGWWLSDDLRAPKRYQIPANTTVPAGGYWAFEAPFGLSSIGDEICLAAADFNGTLTGYRAQVTFGASTTGISFGRIAAHGLPNGKGAAEFWPLTATTWGGANAPPRTDRAIINEIMYHPPDAVGGLDVTGTEFIELHNPTTSTSDLSDWRLKGDAYFTFPSGTSIPPLGYLLVVNFDPKDPTPIDPANPSSPSAIAAFRSAYGLSASVTVVGPYLPNLANSTHNIELGGYPTPNGTTIVYITVDKTEYRDQLPWPTAADGGEASQMRSLQRIRRGHLAANPPVIGNDSDNWAAASPTPGRQNLVHLPDLPRVINWPTASPITYGQTLANSVLTGGVATPAGSFAFATPTSAPGAGSAPQPHEVAFTPSDPVNYLSVTAAVPVIVNKADAVVTTWPTASPISFGQTLASSTLSGGIAIPAGSFAFTTPTTAPGVGTAAQSVTFTPTDTSNFNPVTHTVAVVVNKPDAVVTAWPTASPITYGQPLASATLNGGVASPPGSFTFTAPATTPTAGTAAQSVTFTPTDTANFNPVTHTVAVTVNKANAVVTTWPSASPITYGQALAGSILSGGVATPSGSFAFSIPSASPGAGTAPHGVTFIPIDTANYNPVTGTVTVTVNKANAIVTTWPSASAITSGQALASSTLSGGVATPSGSFTFTFPTTVPGVGTAPHGVTFTPTDTANYNPGTGTVTVTVKKLDDVVTTWPAASPITYGQTLANSTLSGGVASEPGIFAFASPTTAPNAGTAAQSVTFTPTDTSHNPVAGGVAVTVNKADAVVTTWPTASAITYGQTLANCTLSGGLATPSGSFAFTTPSATPGAGTAPHGVTFTPSDTANYNPVTGSAAVTVNKADAVVTIWPTASAITYGQTLANCTLSGGLATPSGSFAFTTPSATPGAGTAPHGVTFTPSDTANYNPVTGSAAVTVNKADAVVTIWPTASAITYGQTLANCALSGGVATPSGSFAFTTSSASPSAGTAAHGVTFTPTDTANYNPVTGSSAVTVNKADAFVTTWPTASAITYGQTLANCALSGGVATPSGSFAFTTSSAPGVGTAAHAVTFTPTDTANYNPVTGSAAVTVNKADAVVTIWPTASAITYGQTLANCALSGGVATPSGSFAFTTSSAPGVGTAAHAVTFTPTDTANYNPVTGSAAVTVNKADAVVTIWPTASAITYGQTLANCALSGGVATPSGSFAFTAPGTAPGVGTAAHGVTFTPTDTANYNPVTGSVAVAVLDPTLPAFPNPVGWWQFDNPIDRTLATIGANLGPIGSGFTAVPGITGSDGAVRVALGSSYTMTHGIPTGTGGGAKVNEYTLLFDVSYTGNAWKTLFQTNFTNVDDGELFIDNLHRVGGSGLGGYSSERTVENTWYRVVLTVANGTARRLYVNGQLWLAGNAGTLDDRYSLPTILRLFADNDGEDGPINVTNVATWSAPLDASQVAALGIAGASIQPPTNNQPPVVTEGETAAVIVEMSKPSHLTFHATDANYDALQWTLTSPAQHGTVLVTTAYAGTCEVEYTPASGYVGPDSFTVQVSDGQAGDSLMVNATVIAPNPDANGNGMLDSWESTYFGNANPGNNAADDDPDRDGLTNFMEYALNTHPLQATTSPLTYDFFTENGSRYLRLTAPKNPAATNLQYSVETSVNSTRWSSARTVIEETDAQIRARDIVSTTTAPRNFIRLKVSVKP